MARTLPAPCPTLLAALGAATLLAACGGPAGPGVGGLDVRPFPDLPAPDVDVGQPDLAPPEDAPPDADPGPDPSGDVEPDAPGTPVLAFVPAEGLDLGFCAQEVPVSRVLTVTNQGTAHLHVTAVTVAGAAAGEYTVEAAALLASPLAAKASLPLKVTARNAGAATGTMDAVLRIDSDDPARPRVEIPLSCQRSGAPVCRLNVVPGADLDLGTLPAGSTKDVPLNLVNTGTGILELRSLDAHACGNLEGAVKCGPFLGAASWVQALSLSGLPVQVPAGSSAQAVLRVTIPAAPAAKDLAARLAIGWACLSGEAPPTLTWPDDCEADAACPPNVTAQAGPALLKAEPSPVAFPDTPPQCESRAFLLLRNPGSGTVSVTGLEVDPECEHRGAFRIVNQPSLPASVSPGGSLSFPVAFAPEAPGPAACDLRVTAKAGAEVSLRVPLSGTGTTGADVVDVFTADTRDADVLFLVDSSGSMMEALERTKSGLSQMMKAYSQAGTRPRLGVVGLSTDADACPRVGALRGPPRILDADTWDAFPDIVDAMMEDFACDPSAGETGLEAARLALSSPRIDDLGTACAGDGACPPPYGCVEGACGGPNRGFLRPQASLEAVVITDEDDQSPLATADYALFLLGLKGTGGEGRARLHVLGGDRGTGCDNAFDLAEAADRYLAVSDATGGSFATLCQESLEDALAQVAKKLAPLRARFPLSGEPREGSVAVTVGGEPCTEGWTVKGTPRVVEFDRAGACFPAPGAEIRVTYAPACP